MKFTAEDIRIQRFQTKLNGYDKEDVLTYLQLVADDFEDSERGIAQLRNQLNKQEKILQKHKENGDKLNNKISTLSKEKSLSSDEALKKGKEIIQNALNRAREIKELTEDEVYKMEREILILEGHKKRLMETIK